MIVITAPTSNIGSQVLDRLLGGRTDLRVVAREPARLSDQVREQAEVVPGSHGNAEVVDQAFEGADAVLWLPPPDPTAPSLDAVYTDFSRPACDAFARLGVERVVGISALGRGTPDAARAGYVTASLAMDDMIAASSVAWTT